MTQEAAQTIHDHIEHDATPDQAAAVEAGAKKSPSLLDAPATYLLIFLNLLYFAAMVKSAPGTYSADLHAHRYWSILTDSFQFNVLEFWGGCGGNKVLNYGQWIRVLSATFMHLNPLHLLINMWCLWNLGLLGEPLLGRRGLISVYVLTGMAGNLCSLAYNSFPNHQDGMVVGASGAIFGIAGILIVLLSNRKLSLPWEELRSLRRSVIQFAVLNVLLGIAPQVMMGMVPAKSLGQLPPGVAMLTHVDNKAHLGGLFCGLLMGLPLFPRMLTGRASYRERQSLTFGVTAFVLMLFAYSVAKYHGR
jgi:rhomboid protease GluP